MEFAEYEPSAWIAEDGVCVIPVRVKAERGPRRLVKDTLLKACVAGAVALCFSASSTTSMDVVESQSDAMITVPTSRVFATTEDGDIDPRAWGRVIQRLRGMKSVEGERDFENEPEPFI
jgi:hypothetical protein